MGVCKKRTRTLSPETARKKRMGRPKEYSDSWTKKLILLRHCGLGVKDILQLLHTQGKGLSSAKQRRSQQLVKELLAEGDKRYRSPDEGTARTRAAFLRAALRRRGKSTLRNGATVAALQPPPPPAGQHLHRTLAPTTGWTPDWDIAAVCTACGAYEQGHLCWSEDMVPAPVSKPPSRNRAALLEDTTPNHDARLGSRKRLSTQSFNSSFVSDIISLIDRRFSHSTYDTSDRYSISAFSETDAVVDSLEVRVKRALAMRQEKHVQENTALIQRCCSRGHDCIHKLLEELILAGAESPQKTLFELRRTGNPNQEIRFRVAVPDPYNNDALFFAARVAAPVDTLLVLNLWATNPNFIDASGQTWLHSLDSRIFQLPAQGPSPAVPVESMTVHGCRCGSDCYFGFPHHSRFECLMLALEQTTTFPYDHLDNDGRHFLFYLCSSPAFNLHWLLTMIRRYPEWKRRVSRVSQLRDRAGLFLVDYLATRTDFAAQDTDVLSFFQPDWVKHLPTRLLTDEDDSGRTALHVYIQEDFFIPNAHPALPFPNDVIIRDINKYDDQGRTPIMALVETAFERDLDEQVLCTKVERLSACGANINACSRSGTTVLLFAARKAYPRLVDLLLRLGANPDHRDDKGQDALAHVAKTTRISQSAKRPVELLARSFKSAAKLLDPGIFHKTSPQPSVGELSGGELAARSKQTLRKLLEHIESEPSTPFPG